MSGILLKKRGIEGDKRGGGVADLRKTNVCFRTGKKTGEMLSTKNGKKVFARAEIRTDKVVGGIDRAQGLCHLQNLGGKNGLTKLRKKKKDIRKRGRKNIPGRDPMGKKGE